MTTVVSETQFAQDAVKQLSQDDFELETDAPIKVRYDNCMLILFYDNNVESSNLLQVWYNAAAQIVGPSFGAINLTLNKQLSQAFTRLNMYNTPLHWAGLKTVPFVLVYQNRWPIGFYNGARTVQDIIDYSLTLACKAEYHEPMNMYGGILATNNLTMKGLEQYGSAQNPIRTTSLQYQGGQNIRPYDPNDQVILEATKETTTITATQKEMPRPTEPKSPDIIETTGVRVVVPTPQVDSAITGSPNPNEPERLAVPTRLYSSTSRTFRTQISTPPSAPPSAFSQRAPPPLPRRPR